ncbi:PREDICTED: endothelial zinc finger protein induced by tumor necrosis factor alpha-like [Priapulus caudatus]|uniref:Endothelial zinc finger protein induced by tumor necrosis factor alpha-like n=1 Tax=Priapulus caudatus TaxID=37621 RepID=A0ABM1DV52_PRICU|nr:PREDICTED: endothelial zinc finger protein induced by tumor necrosis factor alpha-like [Priapulus caudatus]
MKLRKRTTKRNWAFLRSNAMERFMGEFVDEEDGKAEEERIEEKPCIDDLQEEFLHGEAMEEKPDVGELGPSDDPAPENNGELGPGDEPAPENNGELGPGDEPAPENKSELGPGDEPAPENNGELGPGDEPAPENKSELEPGDEPAPENNGERSESPSQTEPATATSHHDSDNNSNVSQDVPLYGRIHAVVNGDAAAAARYTCGVCGESLSSAKNLKRHTNIHTRAEVFTCKVCSRGFIRKDYMVMHMKVHYGKKPHRCILCNKGFVTKLALDSHKVMCRLVDRSRDNHTCETCGEVFSSVRNLKRHVNKHTLEDVYTCPICSRPFLRQDYLQHHMRKKHNGAKYHPYQCTFCYKLFHSNIKLQEHLQTHTGNRSFSCTICHEAFSSILALKVHMRIHLQEKCTKDTSLRRCDICGVGFPGAVSLNKHKLYQHNFCAQCERVFTDRATLEAHKLRHESTDANPYRCDICRRTFAERGDYNSHICAASSTAAVDAPPLVVEADGDDCDEVTIVDDISQPVAPSRGSSPDHLAKVSVAFWQNISNGEDCGAAEPVEGSTGATSAAFKLYEMAGLPIAVESVVGGASLSCPASGSPSPNSVADGDVKASRSYPTLANCLSSGAAPAGELPVQRFQPRANPRKSSTPKRSEVAACKSSASGGLCLSSAVSLPCQQMATSSHQLVDQRVVNMSELSECSHCGMYFSDRTMYIMHMGLHVPDNPWQCNLCGEACHDRYSFAVHVMKTQH